MQSNLPVPNFYVDTIPVYGDLILSPMDGYSDQPFRSLCRQLGSAMSYTEFVNALDLFMSRKAPDRELRKLEFLPEERPVVFQLFDAEPDRLVAVAERLQELEPDIIDINMGCSAKCVSGRGAGAGLLREPQKIAKIFNSLTRTLRVPVTGKIRLGWDDNERNYLDVAKAIEDNGGKLIAVHGRTKVQGYTGEADWRPIAEVKAAVKIPVLGNGDVRSLADIDRIKAETGCDGVLIGRAAMGNPWIFSRLDREQVSLEQVRATIVNHLNRMLAFYPGDRGLVIFRKHAARYLGPLLLTPDLRRQLFTTATPADFLALLDQVLPSTLSLHL